MKIRSTTGAGLKAVLLMAVLAAVGCGHETDKPKTNQEPFVKITGGPLANSSDSYTARIFWSGWDEDGIVDHYEYALDPPLEFTDQEIGHPETSPGVKVTVIPGPTESADTLVVSKPAGQGGVVSFRWIQTREFSRAFAFKTPNPDTSTGTSGTRGPTDTFSGTHTVYVRAQDDDEDYSESDHLGYTAITITPEATIRRPNISAEYMTLGSTLTINWDGLDPDSPEANKKPTGYIYRLLRLDTLEPPIPLTSVPSPNILYDKGDLIWTYQKADTLQKTFKLTSGGSYVFGVRAVDVAGGTEPFLEFGRNAFKFQAFASAGKPDLTVCERAIGCFSSRGVGIPVEVEVPTGRDLKFTWQGNADGYGGVIEAYSWGMDIPDLDVEGPGSGWSPWGLIYGNQVPIRFTKAGVHVLYVRVRDLSGAVTLSTLILNVIEFPFDKEVLWVDDYSDDTYPRDAQHDAFWRSMFAGYGKFGTGDVSEFHSHLADDRGSIHPRELKLSDLGRYKLLVWDNWGVGFDGDSGLFRVTVKPTLASYLGAGGKFWLSGRMTIGATTPDVTGLRGDLNYPKELEPGDFAWDYLKLHTTKLDNDKGKVIPRNDLLFAHPFPGRAPIYNDMKVDSLKQSPGLSGKGITHTDAVFDPIFTQSEPDFKGTLDSLYVYGATGNEVLNKPSPYHNRLIAVRWHDPDAKREHGRIQWFGFELYYFLDSQAQDTFNRSIDWLREEQIGVGTPK